MFHPSPIRRGFTLIQLLVIIGVLLILAALLIPAVQRVRVAAGRAQSQNNLKQLSLAYHNYNDVHKALPPIAAKANNQEGSLLFHLLPYIEQDNTYQQAKGYSWNLAGTVMPLLVDPEDPASLEPLFHGKIATTNYAGSWLGFKDGTNVIPGSFPDGTSNTIMFATRYQRCNGTPNAWAYPSLYTWTPMFAYYSEAKFQLSPKQEDCDPHVPQSIGAMMLVGMCDGSVRTLSPEMSPRTWKLALDPADGNPLDADF